MATRKSPSLSCIRSKDIPAFTFNSNSCFPNINRYINGTPGDLIPFEGNRTFKDLYAFIREIKPMVPERVETSERLEQLRAQVAHHLIVGLLFDKAPMVTVEVERSLYDM